MRPARLSWTRLAWTWLWARPLATGLSLLLMALGLGAITFVLVVGQQVEQRFERDLRGVDLVVGAQGSPLQLILSAVFHIDQPTGNIPVAAIQTLQAHPLVARVIPMSLGDSVQGHRIVGTTHDYLAHQGARFTAGQAWDAPMQAVLGARAARTTGLQLGQPFVGYHGLGEGGHPHGDSPYEVVGILAPTGTVMDDLVLTDLVSVWLVHEEDTATDEEERRLLEAEREVTALLVAYRSPLAAASLPRWVNAQAGLQAASPAVEVTRLLRLLGVGAEVLQGFGVLLLLVAGLSVFIALLHTLGERRHDLAMLRLLGASPSAVAGVVLGQALWLAVLGLLVGLCLGYGLTALLAYWLEGQRSLRLGVAVWPSQGLWLPLLALGVAAAAAWGPAHQAYRLDVAALLQRPG